MAFEGQHRQTALLVAAATVVAAVAPISAAAVSVLGRLVTPVSTGSLGPC